MSIKTKFRDIAIALLNAYRRPKGFSNSKVRFGRGVIFPRSKVVIGDYSFIGTRTILGPAPINIGRYCSIGREVIIGPNSHPIDTASTSSVFYSPNWGRLEDGRKTYNQRKVVIGNDVWIGMRAIIMPGLTIGDGAIVASGSIVTHDVERYTIVAGVPAKIVRMRFSKDLISKLIKECWWENDFEHLERAEFRTVYHGQALVKRDTRKM